MYYESYKKKPAAKRRRRKPFRQWLAGLIFKLILFALIVCIIGAGLLYAIPVSFFRIEPDGIDLNLTDGLPSSHINILLLGVDVLNDNSQRSDTVIVASIGYKDVKLASFMRDTIVDIPGHGSAKLNAAYAYGGPELVMQTLNKNFDLNIIHYVAVDFVSLVDIVNALGGVDIDISQAEMEQINTNVYKSRKVFKPLGYSAQELTKYGESTHLDGLQALGYARIRKIDSDYMRTSRQRTLIKAMIQKLRGNFWNPVILFRLGKSVLNSLNTNMSIVQIISLGEKILVSGNIQQKRFPVDGAFTDNGSSIKITNRSAVISAFQEFAYS